MTLRLVLAALLMALGLYLHPTEEYAHAQAHQAMDHEHVHTHSAHISIAMVLTIPLVNFTHIRTIMIRCGTPIRTSPICAIGTSMANLSVANTGMFENVRFGPPADIFCDLDIRASRPASAEIRGIALAFMELFGARDRCNGAKFSGDDA